MALNPGFEFSHVGLELTQVQGLVQGLHHITLVTSSEAVNRRFYTEILGLRRVKLTVNQDDIYHRHLFYADDKGTTGSAITFFEWPELSKGWAGLSSPHHLAYTVPSLEALPMWKAWLASQGVSVVGPTVRNGLVSLYLRDPDGVLIEIAHSDLESVSTDYVNELFKEPPTVTEILPLMRLTTFNHASPITSDPDLAARFLDKFVGLKNSYKRTNPDEENGSIIAIGNDSRPDFLRYLAAPNAEDGFVGTGSIHHIAMAVEDERDQRKIMERLNAAGVGNSGIVDRFWFKSLYFHDPDGNLLEIATKGPGYTADEPMEKLGTSLVLPPRLESKRPEIEGKLREVDSLSTARWPPTYPAMTSLPERLDQRAIS